MTDFTGQGNQALIQPTPNFAHLAANATTTVKSAGGVLQQVIINTAGSGSNTLTLYDGSVATGTVIAVIDTTSTVPPKVLPYNTTFKTSLTAVMATGTAADVTLTYF